VNGGKLRVKREGIRMPVGKSKIKETRTKEIPKFRIPINSNENSQ